MQHSAGNIAVVAELFIHCDCAELISECQLHNGMDRGYFVYSENVFNSKKLNQIF